MKICSGRFSAGLGAAVSWRGLMMGGGGSTAKRAAADVIGTDGPGAGWTGCAVGAAPPFDAAWLAGRASIGRAGIAVARLAGLAGLIGVAELGRCRAGTAVAIGRAGIAVDPTIAPGAGAPATISLGPRKSLTRVSTS